MKKYILTLSFLQCRDTFYIETFHVVVLIYAPKRINFGDNSYVMRIHLAVLDWVSCYQYLLAIDIKNVINIVKKTWSVVFMLFGFTWWFMGWNMVPHVYIRQTILFWLIITRHFHYRMKMLRGTFPRSNFTSTPGIQTEWPLLECWDQRHSCSERPYGMSCSRGTK